MNIYDFSRKILEMGNEHFILNDYRTQLFDVRQTGKTTNMILKGIFKGFNSGIKDYTIIYATPTDWGKSTIISIETIAKKLGINVLKQHINVIKLHYNDLSVTFKMISSGNNCRGQSSNLVICDEYDFIIYKKDLNPLLIHTDYILGGYDKY